MAGRARQLAGQGRGQIALALAAFIRRQSDLTLDEVARDPECLELASVIASGSGGAMAEQVPAPCSTAGRKRVHDAEWAESALLDIVLRDPDGLPASQCRLVERLQDCFEAAGRQVPGDTWCKTIVRRFHRSAAAFERTARALFQASPALQAVFENEARFLAFRRARQRVEDIWAQNPGIRGRYSSSSELLENLMNADVSARLEGSQFAPIGDFSDRRIGRIDSVETEKDLRNGRKRIDAGSRRARGRA